MPSEVCGQVMEEEGQSTSIYCYEDRWGGALRNALSALSLAAIVYASM